MLEIKNLCFSYPMPKTKEGKYEVIRNLSFSVSDNEFVSIIGPSGCGKSTLLNILAGFERPSSGEILDNGVPVAGISYDRAMVFQQDAVFPWLTVAQNVEYGLKVRKIPASVRKEKVREFVELVNLQGYENYYPKELSGGMKKRVDLARMMANDPRIMLMDEPFGALDAMTKEILQEHLVRIWEMSKKTILFVTHDIEESIFLADRVIVVQNIKNGGRAEFVDVPFKRPRTIKLKENEDFQRMRRRIIDMLKAYESHEVQ